MEVENVLLEPRTKDNGIVEVMAAKADNWRHLLFWTKDHYRNGLILITGVLLLIELIIFKQLFPFANYSPDSYAYISAAARNIDINFWPTGYSKFLRVFGTFTQSDTAVVTFQYFFLLGCTVYFYKTLSRIFKLPLAANLLFSAFLVINPLFLLLCNYIISDPLFIGLTLIWFTQLVNMIVKPTRSQILVHGLLLPVVIAIRYNAIFYPLITVIGVLLTNMRLKEKVITIAVCLAPALVLLTIIRHTYKEETGVSQVAPFGGWQMATNALLAYRHSQGSELGNIPKEFKDLQALVERHRDSLNTLKERPDSVESVYYLWDPRAPLTRYLVTKSLAKDSAMQNFKEWSGIAPYYNRYGLYLIRQHPIDYLQYYAAPNALKFFAPPVEFLSQYNMRMDSVAPLAKVWFKYKSTKIKAHSQTTPISFYLPIVFAVANAVFVLGIIGLLFLEIWKKIEYKHRMVLALLAATWTISFAFNTLAAPIVIRYVIFPALVALVGSLLTFKYIIKHSIEEYKKESR